MSSTTRILLAGGGGYAFGMLTKDTPRLFWAGVIALSVINLGMLGSQRVIVAWMVYFDLRRRPPYAHDPRWRRWLWLRTLARANGDIDQQGRRVRRRRRRG